MHATPAGRAAFLLLLLAWIAAGAQTSGVPDASGTASSDEAASVPVFRANSRLVMVDVVATDSRGHFVPGLHASDFSVLEDGKPQKLWAFGVHTAAAATSASVIQPPDLPTLPPHQFSNFPLDDPTRPITIVLMDLLNTSGMEQHYARKDMLKFLRELPSGQRVALFGLTTHLTMLQGFTSDGATLAAAAKMLLARESPLTTPESQVQQDQVTATMLEAMAEGSQSAGSAAGHAPSIGNAPLAPIAQAIRRVIDEEGTFQQGERTAITLENLKALARAVSGYPGRKSLIWLSADFPVQLGPEFQSRREVRNSRAFVSSIQETAALLAASQIAVFPVDVGGLRSRGTGIDISTPAMVEGSVQDQTGTSLGRQTTAEWDSHEAMGDVARETGGQAFYGSNDLKAAMLKSLEQGSNYYTLAYIPSNKHWNGEYRRIEVKSTGNCKLSYRRGYYGMAEHQIDAKESGRLLVNALAPVVPTSSMILVRVQVLPPDANHKKVRIDYAVDANDVSFGDTPQSRKRAVLDFMTAAWSPDHKLAGHAADTMETEIRPELFEQALKNGLPMHQELELKPGTYTLRLGVIDRTTQRIGTVDVPLTVDSIGTSGTSSGAPKP